MDDVPENEKVYKRAKNFRSLKGSSGDVLKKLKKGASKVQSRLANSRHASRLYADPLEASPSPVRPGSSSAQTSRRAKLMAISSPALYSPFTIGTPKALRPTSDVNGNDVTMASPGRSPTRSTGSAQRRAKSEARMRIANVLASPRTPRGRMHQQLSAPVMSDQSVNGDAAAVGEQLEHLASLAARTQSAASTPLAAKKKHMQHGNQENQSPALIVFE